MVRVRNRASRLINGFADEGVILLAGMTGTVQDEYHASAAGPRLGVIWDIALVPKGSEAGGFWRDFYEEECPPEAVEFIGEITAP